MCRTPNSGFTMIELLVVLAIILVMTGLAVGTLSGSGTPKQQLRREARDLTALLQEARLSAMERKLKIEVYINPPARTVYAVESGYARKLLAADDGFFSETAAPDGFVPETNRFFRTAVFPETIAIEPFALQEIEPETPGTEPLFEAAPEGTGDTDAAFLNRPVFSFTSLGGATGGGISVVRGEVRIDIACDLLTGLPEIVRRRAIK
ncbi:MAG TPA: prepilin-type N-terminal cleavage/methylation domain-containing protein [Pontiellaceae bacterium]|nr:prepilin-type N-terminal cleavage/methylation domain-containing protein [Pontiellaceae bacterium]HPR82655.1 prepilin-type N-terminal cleavage/methylation domain-containing protein [Pontiellaceae bacterium]